MKSMCRSGMNSYVWKSVLNRFHHKLKEVKEVRRAAVDYSHSGHNDLCPAFSG